MPASKSHAHLTEFYWQGIDSQGSRISGHQHASNNQQLKSILLSQGITTTHIKKRINWLAILTHRKIKAKHIADITQQLALLLSTGFELTTALTLLSNDNSSPTVNQLLTELKQQLEQGISFSNTLSRHPHYFNTIYISLVQAGEASGQLASLLQQLANYQQRQLKLRQKIQRALYYPLIVAITACFITSGLLLFVVPQFEHMFQSMGANLPLLTQTIISLSQLCYHHGGKLSLSIILCSYLFHRSYKHYAACQRLGQWLLLKLPVISRVIHLNQLTRVLYIVQTSLEAGLTLTTALQLSQQSLTLQCYQQTIDSIIYSIAQGKPLQHALKNSSLFPPRCQQLLTVGASTGKLAAMCNTLAIQYQQTLDQRLDQACKLIEPIMMLLLALILGSVIIAMYLPIFNLSNII